VTLKVDRVSLLAHPGLEAMRSRFVDTGELWGNYRFDLCWEAVVRLDIPQATERGLKSLLELKAKRGQPPGASTPYKDQPFACLEFVLWERTGEKRYLDAIHAETLHWCRGAARDEDGLFVHEHTRGEPGGKFLIERGQAYATRCMRIGSLVDDPIILFEGLRQWKAFETVLFDQSKGLWCQGKGWVAPGQLSPGRWSRAQGWVLRGLTGSLVDLKESHPAKQRLTGLLEATIRALVARQSSDGSWHRLLNRSENDSPPDSSGTGMIVAYVSRAINEGMIEADDMLEASIDRARKFLYNSLSVDGHVSHGCPSPGPLYSEEEFLKGGLKSPVDEPHAVFAWLLAAAYERPSEPIES